MPTEPKTGLHGAYAESDLDMRGFNILNAGPLSSTSGFSGYSGRSGYSGVSGYSGMIGISGFSGASGYSAASGYSGVSGRSGYSGFSGANPGASGFSGFSGYSAPGGGASGFSGYSGYSAASPGASGFSGYSGPSGYSGFSGWSGYSGYSAASPGASGYSGLSGRSGYSGFSGAGDILQNIQPNDYTTVLSDDGLQIFHPTSDNNSRTYTIAANASVAYPIGATLTFVNMINNIAIAINSDTLYLANTALTGTRTLAAKGIATALKVSATEWIINGNGLT